MTNSPAKPTRWITPRHWRTPLGSTPVESLILPWPLAALRQTLIALIWAYRVTLSPLIGNSCRHQPTCSENAIRKLHERGPFVGTWLGLKQILTCHPFHTPKNQSK